MKFSAAGTNFNSKHPIGYGWKSAGGKLGAANTSATEIDTTGLAPGTYNVTATLTDPKMKSDNLASCGATFIVKTPAPKPILTVACVPPETSIKAGESASVHMVATNPDNRPLTYAWTTTSGQVSGSGDTATVTPSNNDAGGIITITGTVNDDRNLSASCQVKVTVPKLPPPCVNPASWGECTFKQNPKLARARRQRLQRCPRQARSPTARDDQRQAGNRGLGNGCRCGQESDSGRTARRERKVLPDDRLAQPRLTPTASKRANGGGRKCGAASTSFLRVICAPGHTELGTAVDESAVKGQQRGKLPPKQKAAPKP